ncbi:DUF4169 family protein [Wenxinia marina]|uniref:Uncharacterized protein n=1 Tax=Wenxinia marina DSM 24838 TaxID=1123501 RepID=A0A0D0Q4W2_9RHOB|nr:DUF4169 family protein [Wenxinia marina]KIQ69554.1 hypothetical protein Wenmar_01918 [Wenxinia marina DSM 24838]GGL59292.1 hypothetical protein GCM10011392_12240 [Wenxinia marina]
MTDGPINLNRVRKEKARAERKAQADANAAKFGRSKGERLLDAARAEAAKKRLDGHRFDDE